MTLDRLAKILYVSLPVRLRRASPLLGITLADGIYLTAWPLWAVLAPVAIFAFGFSVGGWHWLPQNIWNDRVTAYPAAAFMQMLPLLVIAVAVGALSAGLGLLLVAGYALGDLLISGTSYAPHLFHPAGMLWWLGHVTTAQLITYLVFLLLAVMPTIVARALTASTPGLRLATRSTRATLRASIAAVLAALLVYAWTLMAPMAVRPLWLWENSSSSPVTVQYFTSVVNPVLPIVAAGFTLVRALIEALANHIDNAKRNAARIVAAYTQPQVHIDNAHRSGWFGAIAGAVIVWLLVAGMITRLWPTGVLMFVGVLALSTMHWVVLPRWAGWRAWTRLMERVPLIVRWLVTLVGAYAIGRSVLAAPGMAVWQNPTAGAFGAELFAIAIGLALTVSLFPVNGESTAHVAPNTSASAKHLLSIAMLVGAAALVMHSGPASAYCLDPLCCFVDNRTAGLVVAGFIVIALVFLLTSPGFWLALAADMMGGWVADLATGIEMGADIGEAIATGAQYDLIEMGAQAGDAVASGAFKEGAKEVLQQGLSAVEDSLHATTQGIADLAHPSPAPYPLGAAGSGPAITSLPVTGNPSFDPTPDTPMDSPHAHDPALAAHARVPIGANDGLESGHAAGFGDVRFGSPVEPGSHYFWISDGHGITISSAHSKIPGTDDPNTITNAGAHVASGGRVWFGPDRTVTVQMDARGSLPPGHDQEQLQAIIRHWQSLGYAVKILPPGT